MQILGFDEYIMHRAISEVIRPPLQFPPHLILACSRWSLKAPCCSSRFLFYQVPDLLRLCPGVFFELMDVKSLLEGNTETRSREAFAKMAPILHPMAGTEGIAKIVFDELVADTENKLVITRQRFEQYLDALYKREFSTNYAEHWSVIKEQCGLHSSEKCILHTPYAADCSQVQVKHVNST